MSVSLPTPPQKPWKTRSTRRVYENKWMSVDEEHLIRPDGKDGLYARVQYGAGSVGVVAFREDGRIPLIGQWRYLMDEFCWGIPAGGRNQGEDPQSAAARELREEAGLECKTWVHIGKGSIVHLPERADFYIARDPVAQYEPQPDETETLIVHWVLFEEAMELVDDGTITGWVSQQTLLKAARFLKK